MLQPGFFLGFFFFLRPFKNGATSENNVLFDLHHCEKLSQNTSLMDSGGGKAHQTQKQFDSSTVEKIFMLI